MFAIAFDLIVEETRKHHPVSVREAYRDIGRTLKQFGFEWVQGSVYITEDESMTNLFAATQALAALPWFSASVRDLRSFRVENWSDFTPLVKGDLAT
ncbi:MAG: virulence-associated protein VapD [Verrucomicrobiales bacterium]|jgi:virulence-associated protein VapD